MNHGGSIQFYGGNRSYDRSYDTLILTEVTTFLFCVCVYAFIAKVLRKKNKTQTNVESIYRYAYLYLLSFLFRPLSTLFLSEMIPSNKMWPNYKWNDDFLSATYYC